MNLFQNSTTQEWKLNTVWEIIVQSGTSLEEQKVFFLFRSNKQLL